MDRIVLTYFSLLQVLLQSVNSSSICSYGQFFNTLTDTCQNCTVCTEITLRTCFGEKDTECGIYKEVFIIKDYQVHQEKTNVLPFSVNNVNEDVSRDESWHNVTVALTCILCSLCAILAVLVVVACVMYRNSRIERQANKANIPDFCHEVTSDATMETFDGVKIDKVALLTNQLEPNTAQRPE